MSFMLLGILNSQAAGGGLGEPAYEHIQTFSTTSNAFSVQLANLPQDYKHLRIVHSFGTGQSGTTSKVKMLINNDSATNYSQHITGYSQYGQTRENFFNQDHTHAGWMLNSGNNHNIGIVDLMNYSSSSIRTTTRMLSGTFAISGFGSNMTNDVSATVNVTFKPSASGEYLVAAFKGTNTFKLYGVRG